MLDSSKIFHYFSSAKEKISQILGDIFDFWHIRIYLAIAALLNISAWLLMFFIRSQAEQSRIVLHYNVDFGADLIGKASQLTIIPALGLIVLVINLSLTFLFVNSNNFKFLSHLFLFTAVAVNLFLLASLAPIYLINFR